MTWVSGCCFSLWNENLVICKIALVLSQAWWYLHVIPAHRRSGTQDWPSLHSLSMVSMGYRKSCHKTKLALQLLLLNYFFPQGFGGRHIVYKILFLFIYLAHVYMGTFIPEYTCGDQRPNYKSQLAPSTMRVLRNQTHFYPLNYISPTLYSWDC